MTKRRNMAIAMAGAMVATTGAQAFATSAQEQTNFVVNASEQAKLVSKVGELLDVEYTSMLDDTTSQPTTTTKSVYEISIDGQGTVANKTDFKNKLVAALEGKTLATVTITDKGHEVVGNEIVDYTTVKYDLASLAEVKNNSTLKTLVEDENGIVESNGKLTITLKSGEVIELAAGSDVLDFTKALDENGEITTKVEEVVSFAKKYDKIKPVTYTVKLTTTDIMEVEVDTLFDGVFLTEDGQKLVDFAKENTSTHTVTVNDIKTTSATTTGTEEKLTGLEVVITKKTLGRTTEVADGQEAIITINGEEEVLKGLKDILVEGAETPVKLAGIGRCETAVEVSKELRKNGASKKSVVLASATSLVDGLAAGPLAAQLNTSILLTNKDAAPEVTMKELAEVLDLENTKVNALKDKTVYIIGGENVISEAVVAQIEALGVTVERLAGNDRHETSLAVANKLVELKGKTTTTESFVVGANGLADAMSISAYAAQTKNPIIVSGFNSVVNDEAVKFMEDKDLTIIGGDAAVSEELEAQLDEANDTKKVERLKGETRFETNAAVINKYYRSASAKAIFVAADGYKAGNDKLVDALTAAPLAAKNNAPIVLATEELSKDQAEALELVNVESNAKIFQVGGQVINTVIAKIAKILG